MYTNTSKEAEKTDFHYFCSLLIGDIQERAKNDTSGENETKLARKLVETIQDAQEFMGHNAPVDEGELMADIAGYEPDPYADRVTVWPISAFSMQLLRRALLTICLALVCIFGFSQHGQAYADYLAEQAAPTSVTPIIQRIWPTVKPGDTVRVGLRTSCAPSTIYTGYRIRVRLSDTASGIKYLGPDKQPIKKGCQILEIIRMKGQDLSMP